MSELPASPRAARLATPSWLDGRLVLGVLLVLVSVVVGARVLATADRSQQVWVATRDLAPGSTLAPGDLQRGRVRLFGASDRYLVAVGAVPVGYVLAQGVGTAELLPRRSLLSPGQAAGRSLREVSVPVEAGHLPDDLQSGQQVDVYVTPGTGTGTGAAAGAGVGGAAGTRLVLSGVPVLLRPRDTAITATRVSAVVLSVGGSDAAVLVAALQEGKVDLVRVPRDGEVVPLAVPAPTVR